MNNIDELIIIIKELGGSATSKEISTVLAKRYKMVIFPNHIKTIEATLSNNTELVRKNNQDGKWELVDSTGKYLYVSDNVYYDSNRDAMLKIFGQSVSSGGSYFKINDSNDYAWFPKFNDANPDWTNTLEENGTLWKEKPNNPLKAKDRSLENHLRYTFASELIDGTLKKRFTGVFRNESLENDGTKVYRLVDDKVMIKKKKPLMIVCNIGYMKHYRGVSKEDQIYGGGKYPTQNGDGGEVYNFEPRSDGFTYGFVETNYSDSKNHMGDPKYAKNILIENIDPIASKADYIDGVRVVFIAKGPSNDRNVVIGWYDDATVFRKRQVYGEKFGYNIKCKNENAHLIDDGERSFYYPKKNTDGSYNFGQLNISYPYRQDKTTRILADRLNEYLNSLNNNHKMFFFFFFFGLNSFFYEPVNLNQWNMFERIKGIGHQEYFLATKNMKPGDYLILHVGSQKKGIESGVYCICRILTYPEILRDHPGDYCNNRLSVNSEVVAYSRKPLMTHEQFAQYCTQFRTVHAIDSKYDKELADYFGIEADENLT